MGKEQNEEKVRECREIWRKEGGGGCGAATVSVDVDIWNLCDIKTGGAYLHVTVYDLHGS
jgi:hypothetical protein